MKISIHTDASVLETEISISCSRLTPEIDKVLSLLRMMDRQLTGQRDGEIFIIDLDSVLYIDTADKKTFIYTGTEVYESSLRLYELEQQLLDADFFRANKSCIINLKHVASLKADIDRRIKVKMNNGEQLIVSRQYSESFKKRLGVK